VDVGRVIWTGSLSIGERLRERRKILWRFPSRVVVILRNESDVDEEEICCEITVLSSLDQLCTIRG